MVLLQQQLTKTTSRRDDKLEDSRLRLAVEQSSAMDGAYTELGIIGSRTSKQGLQQVVTTLAFSHLG